MSHLSPASRLQAGHPVKGALRVVLGGRIAPRDSPAPQRAANEDNPASTIGDAAIHAEPLPLERFVEWELIRGSGCDLTVWTMSWAYCVGTWRAGQRAFIFLNDGRYKVPNRVFLDWFAVPVVAKATFVAVTAAYLGGEGRGEVPPFLSTEFDDWWGRGRRTIAVPVPKREKFVPSTVSSKGYCTRVMSCSLGTVCKCCERRPLALELRPISPLHRVRVCSWSVL